LKIFESENFLKIGKTLKFFEKNRQKLKIFAKIVKNLKFFDKIR